MIIPIPGLKETSSPCPGLAELFAGNSLSKFVVCAMEREMLFSGQM